jgi:hypothetical protein
MPVVQDSFFIPEDIATGLATGLYRRIGSVVRYAVGPNKGQIVKHLKSIDLKTAEEAQGLGVKALQFVKEHKKGIIITVATAAVVGTGAFVYSKVKNREPKVVSDFRAALRVYIAAIREGNMDIDKINNMMNALEELKQHKNYDKISIQLTTDDLEVLVGRIYEYTIKLAKDNDIELSEDELQASNTKPSETIINLQNYLKAQMRIFEEAA